MQPAKTDTMKIIVHTVYDKGVVEKCDLQISAVSSLANKKKTLTSTTPQKWAERKQEQIVIQCDTADNVDSISGGGKMLQLVTISH